MKKQDSIINAKIPAEIAAMLKSESAISTTPFEKKNDILTNKDLKSEVGFAKTESGDYIVSMICPLPGVTAEMVERWFWWHPQKSERYRRWFPGEHYFVGYSRKNRKYFSAPSMPPFENNSQFPIEKIGKIVLPLRIDFVSAKEFGFSANEIEKGGVKTIVCGHVSAMYGLVKHTEMAHIFFEAEDGLFLVSRFWLGKNLKNPLLRKLILTDETAKGMAQHCCTEYRNLAKLLPKIF